MDQGFYFSFSHLYYERGDVRRKRKLEREQESSQLADPKRCSYLQNVTFSFLLEHISRLSESHWHTRIHIETSLQQCVFHWDVDLAIILFHFMYVACKHKDNKNEQRQNIQRTIQSLMCMFFISLCSEQNCKPISVLVGFALDGSVMRWWKLRAAPWVLSKQDLTRSDNLRI